VTARPRAAQGDDGTVLLLVLGFTTVLLLLVAVVVDVSAVLLAQRGVASAADGAAVAAAQRLDETAFYERGLQGAVPLDPEGVRATVAEYAASVAPVTQLVGGTADGRTVVVRAERVVRLPLGGLGRSSVLVQSVAHATAPVVR
jgi:Flp pilus assembly protein TadG